MLFPMELIFEVREAEEGGYAARAPGHSIFTEERFSVAHADLWETRDFHCRKLAEDVYLLTYTLLQDHARLTCRATIWQRMPDGWKIVYHQGTIVQDA